MAQEHTAAAVQLSQSEVAAVVRSDAGRLSVDRAANVDAGCSLTRPSPEL